MAQRARRVYPRKRNPDILNLALVGGVLFVGYQVVQGLANQLGQIGGPLDQASKAAQSAVNAAQKDIGQAQQTSSDIASFVGNSASAIGTGVQAAINAGHPSQGSANSGSNSFALATGSLAQASPGGQVRCHLVINHQGFGGDFVAVLSVRNAGVNLVLATPGGTDPVTVGNTTFTVQASDGYYSYALDMGPFAYTPNWNPQAHVAIIGLSGELYTEADIPTGHAG